MEDTSQTSIKTKVEAWLSQLIFQRTKQEHEAATKKKNPKSENQTHMEKYFQGWILLAVLILSKNSLC